MSSSPKQINRVNEAAPAPPGFAQRYAVLLVLVLIGTATTGYFIGLTSPMTASSGQPSPTSVAVHLAEPAHATSKVIPATAYADMSAVRAQRFRQQGLPLAALRKQPEDPFAEIEIDESKKLDSLASREEIRAYNGAPPTVPHPIDQLDTAACMACHGEGLKSASLRASKMPHPYYSNCTQCHVEQQANFVFASAVFENSFTGLKAPTSGSRAYTGAPPVIPHSTWMRNDCLSCHGRVAAPGMQSTHPWRANCLQCHGESSQLNQDKFEEIPQFLAVPVLLDINE
ncbi:diheme cytochrome c precursor [Adhaeretor mobilis]|uniref:Nitrate reductase cytochrome c-type subunit (NapB) n=1 Tax=Adhaeretor mobilis TaxID=1930276 RepID=A0A517MVH7_9BACT|nr:diheme cytochrome c precursor [Adhaeretor mobilis]QDS98797.1 Nitrate reductase cytochrome c-type subunit (NapB) [Adhaeretor mobilis]